MARPSGRAYWWVPALLFAVVTAGCAGPNEPTPPPPPPPPTVGPATPPVVRSITVPAARVEAGQSITITAVVEDAETPLNQLTYVWAANVGTITGTSATATWQHPAGLKQGANVVVTLTVIDIYDAVVNNAIVKQEFRVVSQAAPFRVHDSQAELKELSRKFLLDLFGNSTIPPAACLVDFTETGRCASGKAAELDDIISNRQEVVILSAAIHRQDVSFENPVSATVLNYAEFHDRDISTGILGMTLGDFVLTAIYEADRWWLCESRYFSLSGQGTMFDYYRKRSGGRPPIK